MGSLGTASISLRLLYGQFKESLDRVGRDAKNMFSGMAGDADRSLEDIGKSFQRQGTAWTKAVTVPLAGVATAATAAALRLGNTADKLLDLEQQTGLSIDRLQEFRAVARVAGVDQDALAGATAALTRRLSEGGEMSSRFEGAVSALGLSARDAHGNLRPLDELVPQLVTKLQGVEDVTRRNVLATEVFGSRAQELIPVLGMTADEYENIAQKARESGEVMSRETLEAANDVRIQYEELRASLNVLGRDITIALLPAVSSLVEAFQENVVPMLRSGAQAVARMATAFGELSPRAQQAVVILGGLAAAVGPFLSIVGRLIVVIPRLVSAFAALRVAALALFGPAGIIAAGVLALGGLAFAMAGGGRNSMDEAARRGASAIAGRDRDSLVGALDELIAKADGPARTSLQNLRSELVLEADVGDVIEKMDAIIAKADADTANALARLKDQLVIDGDVTGFLRGLDDIIDAVDGPTRDALTRLRSDLVQTGDIGVEAAARIAAAFGKVALEPTVTGAAAAYSTAQLDALTTAGQAMQRDLVGVVDAALDAGDFNQAIGTVVEAIGTLENLRSVQPLNRAMNQRIEALEVYRDFLIELMTDATTLGTQGFRAPGAVTDPGHRTPVASRAGAGTGTTITPPGADAPGTVPDVFQQLSQAGGLSVREARRLLEAGAGPEVVERDLRQRAALVGNALDTLVSQFYEDVTDAELAFLLGRQRDLESTLEALRAAMREDPELVVRYDDANVPLFRPGATPEEIEDVAGDTAGDITRDTVTTGVTAASRALRQVEDLAFTSSGALSEFGQAVVDAFDSLADGERQIADLSTILGDAFDAPQAEARLLRSTIDSLVRIGIDPASDAVQELADRYLALTRATDGAADSTEGVEGTLRELGLATIADRLPEFGRDVQEVLESLTTGFERADRVGAILGDRFDTSSEKARLLESALTRLAELGIEPDDALVTQLQFALETIERVRDAAQETSAELDRADLGAGSIASVGVALGDLSDEARDVLADLVDGFERADRVGAMLGDRFDTSSEKARLLESALTRLAEIGIAPDDPLAAQLQFALEAIERLRDTVQETSDELEQADLGAGSIASVGVALGDLSDEAREVLTDLVDGFERADRVGLVLGDRFDENTEKIRLLQSALTRLAEIGLTPADPLIQQLRAALEQLEDLRDAAPSVEVDTLSDAGIAGITSAFGEFGEDVQQVLTDLVDGFERADRVAANLGDRFDVNAEKVALLQRALTRLAELEVGPADPLVQQLQSALELAEELGRAVVETDLVPEGIEVGGPEADIIRDLALELERAARRGEVLGDRFDTSSAQARAFETALTALADLGLDRTSSLVQLLTSRLDALTATEPIGPDIVDEPVLAILDRLSEDMERAELRAAMLGDRFDLSAAMIRALERALTELADLGLDPTSEGVGELITRLEELIAAAEQTDLDVGADNLDEHIREIVSSMNDALATAETFGRFVGDSFDVAGEKVRIVELALRRLAALDLSEAREEVRELIELLEQLRDAEAGAGTGGGVTDDMDAFWESFERQAIDAGKSFADELAKSVVEADFSGLAPNILSSVQGLGSSLIGALIPGVGGIFAQFGLSLVTGLLGRLFSGGVRGQGRELREEGNALQRMSSTPAITYQASATVNVDSGLSLEDPRLLALVRQTASDTSLDLLSNLGLIDA